MVLHDIKSVVIAVRGTETPEDLITDGLCRETSLTSEDLDGLIKQVTYFPYCVFSVKRWIQTRKTKLEEINYVKAYTFALDNGQLLRHSWRKKYSMLRKNLRF